MSLFKSFTHVVAGESVQTLAAGGRDCHRQHLARGVRWMGWSALADLPAGRRLRYLGLVPAVAQGQSSRPRMAERLTTIGVD